MKCDVCGKEVETYVACSGYGAVSYAYCKECLVNGREPYNAIVAYISCAGHFPDDINKTYRDDVRRQLKLYGISEEQFIKDIDNTIEKDCLCMKELDKKE